MPNVGLPLKSHLISGLVVLGLLSCDAAVQKTESPIKGPPSAAQAARARAEGGLTDGFSDPTESSGDSSASVLEECGITGDLNDPATVLLEQDLVGHAFRKGRQLVVDYEVTVDIGLHIKSTPGNSTNNTTLLGVTAKASGFQSKVEKKAREQAGENIGSTISDMASTDERIELQTKFPEEWNGIYCTVTPVKKIVTTQGTRSTTVQFANKPVPASISPFAMLKRYQAEIGQGKTFQGIEATVQNTNDERLQGATTLTGTVRIQPITPNVTLPSGQTIQAETAFSMVTDFGGREKTAALGLKPEIRFYFAGKRIVGLGVDSGDPESADLTFFTSR